MPQTAPSCSSTGEASVLTSSSAPPLSYSKEVQAEVEGLFTGEEGSKLGTGNASRQAAPTPPLPWASTAFLLLLSFLPAPYVFLHPFLPHGTEENRQARVCRQNAQEGYLAGTAKRVIFHV
jgi:hypothetical protein